MLYCASTTGHLKNFHLPYLNALAQQGWQVTACADREENLPSAVAFFPVPFCKKITSPKNLKNILRVYRFLKQERFAVISVHTTLAAAIVRAAVLLLPRQQRPKVIYTCHGYLFGDADGWRKWKYLLPEKLCARVTDILLVMNREDSKLAERYHLYNRKQIAIPGMGVAFSRFDLAQKKHELRQQYGIAEDAVLFVFAGEFSARKNQAALIDAFAQAAGQMPKAKLILAGSGALLEACKAKVKALQLENKICFPGQVANMPALYHCCDVCVSASRIEGLPFNIMEAMYCALPCVASAIKGHVDLLEQGQTGYLCETKQQMTGAMVQLYQDAALRQRMGQAAKQAVQLYQLDAVLPEIMRVYEEVE